MCFRKVSDMEVVANARSVGRVVIGSENREIKRSPAATFKTGGGEVTLDLARISASGSEPAQELVCPRSERSFQANIPL